MADEQQRLEDKALPPGPGSAQDKGLRELVKAMIQLDQWAARALKGLMQEMLAVQGDQASAIAGIFDNCTTYLDNLATARRETEAGKPRYLSKHGMAHLVSSSIPIIRRCHRNDAYRSTIFDAFPRRTIDTISANLSTWLDRTASKGADLDLRIVAAVEARLNAVDVLRGIQLREAGRAVRGGSKASQSRSSEEAADAAADEEEPSRQGLNTNASPPFPAYPRRQRSKSLYAILYLTGMYAVASIVLIAIATGRVPLDERGTADGGFFFLVQGTVSTSISIIIGSIGTDKRGLLPRSYWVPVALLSAGLTISAPVVYIHVSKKWSSVVSALCGTIQIFLALLLSLR